MVNYSGVVKHLLFFVSFAALTPVVCHSQTAGDLSIDSAVAAIRAADYALVTRANDLFPPYPDQHRTEQIRDKARRGLYKDLDCTVWFSRYGVDIYRLHTILSRAVFVDGPRSAIPVSWVGTFHDIQRPEPLNDILARSGIRPALIQGRFAGRLLVLVYQPAGLRPEHLIHEALHFYFREDDVRLAGRLGVEVTGADTTAISREIGRHCKF